jgi:hypothetical protein
MDATLWTGNGNPTVNIVNADKGTAGFKPDLVWVKERSATNDHALENSVRGAGNMLFSNLNIVEYTATIYGQLSSFNSNGFSASKGTTSPSYYNDSGQTYVAWQWQAGAGTTSSNTNGSITSTVSVNQTAGFSVVTYTGNNSSGQTVGHGLGVAPSFIIVKCATSTTNWESYHVSLGVNYTTELNLTSSSANVSNYWGSSAPTSTVFGIAPSTSAPGYNTNINGGTMVAYCWAPIAGFSQFGSYTGNGSTDGPFIYCGFKPAFIMIKCINTNGYYWVIFDTTRNPYNSSAEAGLWPNASDSEANYSTIDMLSNGVKIRETSATVNGNGNTYIYAAFAENPFKYANAR